MRLALVAVLVVACSAGDDLTLGEFEPCSSGGGTCEVACNELAETQGPVEVDCFALSQTRGDRVRCTFPQDTGYDDGDNVGCCVPYAEGADTVLYWYACE